MGVVLRAGVQQHAVGEGRLLHVDALAVEQQRRGRWCRPAGHRPCGRGTLAGRHGADEVVEER